MSKIFKSAGAIIGGVVGFMIGGPMGAAIGFGLGATKIGNNIINKVLDFVTKPFLGAFGAPDAGQYSAEREEGVVITKRGGGTEQIPVVYGFRQVGGIITFATTGSDRNKYLWVAYVLSEGPVEGIHSLFIDDNDVTQTNLIGALNRGEQVEITSGKYNGRVKMQFWYGKNYGTAASSSPVGANLFFNGEAPGWRTTDAYNGLATLFVRYEWKQVTTQDEANNNPFSGNIPSIKVNLLGRRVLPIDATASTTSYIDDINANRERYSTNPAEIIADYLRNPWYGKGLSNSEIDWVSFQTARDKYNQDVTYVNGVRGPILTTNCVLDSGVTLMGNIKTLLAGCRSYMPYVQGKYKLKVEDAGNPTDILSGSATVVATFTPDNIVGDISWGGVPRDTVYSEYEVTYVDPTNKWSTNTVVYPPTEAERIEYQVLDGGRVNKGSTTFPTITNYAMAYDMARLLFFKSRTQETLNLKVTSQAMELEPGDNIQVSGNTLNFVTGETAVPWRIISIKANDDYSFDLGCVSNPDTIYPHARAGERDIVLPPFIPRYESIVYPTTDVDLSLYPPSYAYTGSEPITSPINPPGATDPTGPTGGGVGDQNGEQNQNPITVPPPPAPPVVEVFNHRIDFTNVTYTVNGNSASATLTWTQPDSPSYAGVDFWISSIGGASPNYTLPASTQVPGIGRTITYIVNNLTHAQTYKFFARVKYSNGNSSIAAVMVVLNSGNTANSGDVQETALNAGPGWQPEGGVSTYVNSKNTTFASISATSSLDGSNNRLLALSIRQDISVQAGGINPEVNGVNIYYKLNANTYWKKLVHNFDGAYLQGNTYTFTPNLDLGVGTPSEPFGDTDPGDNFDLVFRFTYRDGTESTVQWRYMNVDIQRSPSIVFPFLFNESTTAATAPVIVTEDQAPPGSVVDTRDMTIGLATVEWRRGTKVLFFSINPPDVSNRPNWYGVNIRYRVIPFNSNIVPNFETVPVLNISSPWTFTLPIPREGEYYQIALTPIVRYSGTRTESYNSWYGEGIVTTVYDSGGFPDDIAHLAFFTRMNFRTIQTSQIAGVPIPPPPTANPVVTVKSFTRKNGTVNATGARSADPTNRQYFELVYNTDHIVNATNVRIYRRAVQLSIGNGTNSARFYGLGRWEHIDITPSSGDVIVNLRCPISLREFDSYYGVPGYPTAPLLRISNPWLTKKALTNAEIMEIVIVVTTSSGTSEDLAYLTSRYISSDGLSYQSPGPLTDIRPLTQYGGYPTTPVNFLRNLTDSAANRTTNLVSTEVATATWVAPTPQRGGTVR